MRRFARHRMGGEGRVRMVSYSRGNNARRGLLAWTISSRSRDASGRTGASQGKIDGRRQPIDLILGPAVHDRYVLALDIAAVLQATVKCAQTVRITCQAIECGGTQSPPWPTACAGAANGHAVAPPNSVMKARRFTAYYLPCFRTKGIAHRGTAAAIEKVGNSAASVRKELAAKS